MSFGPTSEIAVPVSPRAARAPRAVHVLLGALGEVVR